MPSRLCGLLRSELRFSCFCGKALCQLNYPPVPSFTFFKVDMRRVKDACLSCTVSHGAAVMQRLRESLIAGMLELVELVGWP